jgi:CheY-like chemotaxis protein
MSVQLLLVEDDDDIRMDLCALLDDLGYRVFAVRNGLEALDYLRAAEPPDLILLDLMMPVMDGWQLRLELLKERRLAAIPIMLLSGAGSLATEAAALGAVAFLNKPFNVSQLLRVVQQHCGPPVA